MLCQIMRLVTLLTVSDKCAMLLLEVEMAKRVKTVEKVEEPYVLTVKEISVRWRVSERVVRYLHKTGKLKGCKVGRAFRFKTTDVLKALEDRGE